MCEAESLHRCTEMRLLTLLLDAFFRLKLSRCCSYATRRAFSLSVARPTVFLEVTSLVASRCGYDRGHIEQPAAPEFAVHWATPSGRAKRPPHRHPPHA